MNESNYRNNRFNNKRNNAHKYAMGSLFTKFMHFFNFRFRRNKVNEPLKRVSPISRILTKRQRISPKAKCIKYSYITEQVSRYLLPSVCYQLTLAYL